MSAALYIKNAATDRKQIALTFDDGPHPVFTPQIMDLFQKYGAKGTFFVTGQHVEQYPEIASRLLEEGHEVGNHTYSHPRLKETDPESTKEEIERTEAIILEATGFKTTLFRPPFGSYNEKTLEIIADAGYQCILWSDKQDTKDFSMPGTDRIVEQVIGNLQNGDIILMHDSSEDPVCNREQTVEALTVLLPWFQEHGYECVTVSKLLDN